jgi:outer membrane beta-barrel protein
MKTNSKHGRIALAGGLFVALVGVLAPSAAQAQRKSPLEDAPAIRKRVELRDTRFELGVGVGSTITQDFFHTFLGNVRLGFHLNDWFSIAAFGGFAIANVETGFQDQLTGTLPAMTDPTQPHTPLRAVAQGSMQKIDSIVGGQLEFTPFTGKYSLFGKMFAHYDFYIFAGPGLMDVKPSDASVCTAANTASYCGDNGWKLGGQGGVGLHSFFNQWLALNVELRDFVARLDPSGRDTNGDGVANSGDESWTQTFTVTANLMFFLPYKAEISQ